MAAEANGQMGQVDLESVHLINKSDTAGNFTADPIGSNRHKLRDSRFHIAMQDTVWLCKYVSLIRNGLQFVCRSAFDRYKDTIWKWYHDWYNLQFVGRSI